MISRWVLLAGALASSSVLAGDVADEAEFHFRRGLSFQRRGHIEDALSEFYASNRLVQNRNVQMNIASALGRLGLFDEAFRAYSELERQPLSTDERADVDQALAFLRPKLALVRVDSKPHGAAIYVERRDLGALGQTPKTLALQPGEVKLLLDLAGYRPAEVTVRLERGEQALAARDLERIFGKLDLPSIPPGAQVRRDGPTGEVLRTGPGELQWVPGRLTLHVSAKGFVPSRLEVEVPPDATQRVDLVLAPEPALAKRVGALVVRANLDGALVRVDGKEMGFTPVVIEGVDAGRRVVEVSREGRESHVQEVEVEDQSRRFVDVTLRPKRLEVAGATQRLIRLEDAPASMTVVTADEIRAFGYATVAEALRTVRGLHVWSDRAFDLVGVRGFGLPEGAAARVLVLLNGHPMNDLIRGFGPLGADLGIDLTQVERIEVVRGGGMVFGSTPYLGLINVVTRQPGPGAGLQTGVAIDTFGGLDGRAGFSLRGDWGEALVLAGAQGGSGNALTAVRNTGLLSDGERSGNLHLFGRVGKLSLTAGVTGRSKDVPTGYRWSDGGEVALDDSRAFAALQYDRSFQGGNFLLGRIALDASSYLVDYHPEGDTWKVESGQANGISGEVRLELAVSAHHRLTLGTAGRLTTQFVLHAASSDGDSQDVTDDSAALTLYLSDEWVPRANFRVHLGARLDPLALLNRRFYEDLSSVQRAPQVFLPHLAVVGQPYAGGTTKLLLGTTARVPSVREQQFGLPAFGREKPALLYQEARAALEVEHTHALNDETTITGAVFTNAYNQIIASESRPSSLALQLANSPVTQVVLGTELELRYAPGDGKLASISNVYQTSVDGSNRQLVNAPEHVIAGRFALPVLSSTLRAGTELVFLGARIDRDGLRLDESLHWSIVLSGEHAPWNATYFAGVYNLLDERRPDPLGPEQERSTVPRLGREVRVGFSRRF